VAACSDPQDVDDWAKSLSADEVDDLEGLGRATLDARCLPLKEIGRATDPEDRAYFTALIDERRAALAVAADVLGQWGASRAGARARGGRLAHAGSATE
jgi:hypothetical protein